MQLDLEDNKLYFSTAIEPQINVATTEVCDGFSVSGCTHGTCVLHQYRYNLQPKILTFMLPRLGR